MGLPPRSHWYVNFTPLGFQDPVFAVNVLLTFAAPEYGVAPGQAAVLYDAADTSRVLGGGWIEETFAAE